MTFYHFTAKRFLESIKKEGLTKGGVLTQEKPPKVQWGVQWITKNPNFDQSWLNPNSRLPYKRNEVRLTLDIPLDDLNLKRWIDIKDRYPLTGEILSAFGDPENWYCYYGKIKPDQIIEIT